MTPDNTTFAVVKYGEQGAQLYSQVRHGPDGKLFLDPYFLPFITDNINGMTIADIGTGNSPWAILAAQHGAERVVGVDLQRTMLNVAKTKVIEVGVGDKVFLVEGTAALLPLPDNSVDRALSINVGCNLPIGEFEPHFKEMFRVLKPGALAIVTAPTSFGMVFTTGEQNKELIMNNIRNQLNKINALSYHEVSIIQTHLNTLKNVLRATFAWRNNKLSLITDENLLRVGEPIIRKLPGLTVPNVYHPEIDYDNFAKKAGFIRVTWISPKFRDSTALQKHNVNHPIDQLGEEYVDKPPFAIFVFKKPDSV